MKLNHFQLLTAAFIACSILTTGCQESLTFLGVDVFQEQEDCIACPAPAEQKFVATDAHKGETNWTLFRGDAKASGVAKGELPGKLELLWEFEVKKGAFENTPVIIDGIAYVADLDGHLFALKLADGEKIWEWQEETENPNIAPPGYAASPALKDGLLYIGDFDGNFRCFDAATGKPKWSFSAEATIDSSANFYKDRVIFGSQDATLYCLDAKTGVLVWKHAIEDQIRCTPTIVGDRAFVAGCDSKLHIIDIEKGASAGSVEIDSPTGVTPAVSGNRVFFGTEGGTFYAVDWKESKVSWKEGEGRPSDSYRSSAAISDGLVVVGSRSRTVLAFKEDSGESAWTFTAKGRIDSSPVILGDRVFVGSSSGRLLELNLKTGKKTWEFEANGGFTGSAAIADNRLVIASDKGVVYCFGAK